MKGTRLFKSEMSSSGPVLAPPPKIAANSGSADWILSRAKKDAIKDSSQGYKEPRKPRGNHSFIHILFLMKTGSER